MKTNINANTVRVILACCSVLIQHSLFASDPSPASATKPIKIPAEDQEVNGLLRSGAVTILPAGFSIPCQSVFVPEKNLVWSGLGTDTKFLLVGESLLGFELDRSFATIQVIPSRRTAPQNGQSDSEMVEAESKRATQSPSPVRRQAQFGIKLESMLGSAVFRDVIYTNFAPNMPILYSDGVRKIDLHSVSLSGGNVCADLQVSNLVIKVTLRPDMVPVSVTTNGVSIGPIPTNCVFFSDVITNRSVTRVVY